MCIGVWSTEHRKYALILAANRDEFLSRPTTDATFHSFERDPSHGGGEILSGRDLQAGGSWLGINKVSGTLAFLTNITETRASYEMSRGSLVSYFLQHTDHSPGSVNVKQEIDELVSTKTRFAGFNLLLFTLSSSSDVLSYDATLLTNGGGGNPITSRSASLDERRCGALSNGIDSKDGNEWPKVRHGIAGLGDILTGDSDVDDMTLAEDLFELLSRRTAVNTRSEIRNTIHVDPLMLNSGDGRTDIYGTRSATVVLVKRDGGVIFLERDIWTLDKSTKLAVRAEPSSQRTYKFKLNVL